MSTNLTRACFPVADLRGYLEGSWRLSRRIMDLLAGQSGRFDGHVRFSPTAAGLDYVEDGEISLNGHRGPAYRRYVYRFPEAGRADVRFEDGRAFHPLRLDQGVCRIDHPCGNDRYTGMARALDNSCWLVRWRARGPRKDYVLVNRFVRDAG